MDAEVRTVRSTDGTTIAIERTGTGSPLVLVGGALTDRTQWQRVTPLLAARHTVYAVDRRGRGDSTDATADPADYDPQREIDDVLAVLDAVAGQTARPIDLLGHSSGALLALHAAAKTPHLGRLVAYEPPIGRNTGSSGTPVSARLTELLAAGDRDGVVTTFLLRGVGIPADQLELVRRAPSWPASLALAHTLPYDMLIQEESRKARERLAAVDVPTLLLLGTASSDWMARGLHELAEALPDARLVPLAGQGHLAITEAPELFAEQVLAFLS
jgi:pimeloyl-ACP methyl ester carboxylesterase